MYFFLMFAFLIRNINSLAINTRFCVNCKYIIPDNNLGIAYSKCSFFERINNEKYLISGDPDDIEKEFNFCSTARSFESMCGEDGKKYKKNNKDNDNEIMMMKLLL